MKKNHIAGYAILASTILFLSGCGEADNAYSQGMELAKEGKYEKALPYFEKAVGKGKEKTEYYIGYGMALNHLSQYADAKKQFKEILEDGKTKNTDEDKKQLYYGMAIAEYGLGKYGSVAEYCDKALEEKCFSSMDCDILYTEMAAYWQQGEWESAEEVCKSIIGTDKEYMDAYMALARIERNLGETDKAVQACRDAISVDRRYYDAYFELYGLYVESGQEDAADELLSQIVSLKPNKPENMLAIGRAYYHRHEYDRAKDYLNMAYDGNLSESLYYLGVLSATLKEYDNAIDFFQTYIKESKKDLNVDAYYQLAQVYMEQEEYEKAQSMIAKGISYGNTAATQNLKKTQVILSEKQNHYKEARKLAKEYIQNYPADEGMVKELAFIETRIK